MECIGSCHVLWIMWMAHPNQASRPQGYHHVNGDTLAANDPGIGSGWQQSKQNWARLAVVGYWARMKCSDLWCVQDVPLRPFDLQYYCSAWWEFHALKFFFAKWNFVPHVIRLTDLKRKIEQQRTKLIHFLVRCSRHPHDLEHLTGKSHIKIWVDLWLKFWLIQLLRIFLRTSFFRNFFVMHFMPSVMYNRSDARAMRTTWNVSQANLTSRFESTYG